MNISLEHILGFKVKVTNVLDSVVHGKVYSFNSSNNTLTLVIQKKGKPPTFKIIRATFIKNLEVLSEKPTTNTFKRDPFKPSFVNIERVNQRLHERLVTFRNGDGLKVKQVTAAG